MATRSHLFADSCVAALATFSTATEARWVPFGGPDPPIRHAPPFPATPRAAVT